MSENEKVSAPQKTDNISQSNQLKNIPLIIGTHPADIIQRASMYPQSLTHKDVMQLQNLIGNKGVMQLFKNTGAYKKENKESVSGYSPIQRSKDNTTVNSNNNSEAPIQLFKLGGPVPVKAKLLEKFSDSYDEKSADSVSKEFVQWFRKNRGGALKDHEFASDEEFKQCIDAMVSQVDDFTDQHGYALEKMINEAKSSKVFIGYNGGNAAYKESMIAIGLAEKVKASGLKDNMQLSNGQYVAADRDEAKEYAVQRTYEGKDGVIYKVFIDLSKVVDFPIQLKGASVKQWWKNYDTSFDDDYDIVVAALAGKTDIIQYKINPKSYHLLSFEIDEVIPCDKKK